MDRIQKEYQIDDVVLFQKKALFFVQAFREVVFLNSNEHTGHYCDYESLLAFDALTSIQTDHYNAFEKLKEYRNFTKDWIFGYLSYDLKNDVFSTRSNNQDELHFPELFFFQPKKMIYFKGSQLVFDYLAFCQGDMEADFHTILKAPVSEGGGSPNIKMQQRISQQEYIEKVQEMQDHIRLGNIYEANFCMEFFAENVKIDPEKMYWRLNEISTPPFSAFLKRAEDFAICSSPERYLKKTGNKIISQPIKGTAKRSADAEEDATIKGVLENSTKERAENIMIVDLVRNDLSMTAEKNSVVVEECCKVYSFRQVHQMISTVVSVVSEDTDAVDVIRTTFPMGSMTGAPKLSAMNIIESLEESKRGLYSGAIGYFDPKGSFDFNVVIRSILYNQKAKYVSYSVGSAITVMANPTEEYEECLLKARAMQMVLS